MDATVSAPTVVPAMRNLSMVWNEIFPEARYRLVRLVIARVQLPDDGIAIEWQPAGWSPLAKTFFWQEMLDSGRVKNMTELGKAENKAEKIGLARMPKMLKLARLSPDIAEEIAGGRHPVGVSLLFFVENPLPDDWNAQRDVIGGLAA